MKTTPCTDKPIQPVTKVYAFILASRCGAKTRSGYPCKSPTVKDKARCRMHGGKGSGAPYGNNNAFKHGASTREQRAMMSAIREFIREQHCYIKSIRE